MISRRDRHAQDASADPAVQAKGRRSVAAGGDIGMAVTGDNSPVTVQMPAPDPVVPRQLPAVPADFTGRRAELHELLDQCWDATARRPVVVINGMAGVGKSALALRLAHDLTSYYPDGQLYCGLRSQDGPLRPELVLPGFLRALGTAADDVPFDPAEQSALFRSLLAGRRIMVVLDDAASEQQVRPLLPGGACSLVLITSRNPLPALPGAANFRLDLLSPDESLELLDAIAGSSRVAADPAACYRVVELCGRLPLALRIAAARLRARNWAPADLATLLSDAQRRLRELHVGDLDIRTIFELSYRDLPADAARLFRMLAATPGPTFGTELLTALMNIPEPETEALIDRLLLDQLIEPANAPGRYRMHDLMRLLAEKLLAEQDSDDRQTALDTVIAWYGIKLLAVGSCLFGWPADEIRDAAGMPAFTPAEGMAWLEAEDTTLIGMLTYASRIGRDCHTVALAGAVMDLVQYRAMWGVAEEAGRLGLAAAHRLNDRDGQARLLKKLSSRYNSLDFEYGSAIDKLTRAVEVVEDPNLARDLHLALAHEYRAVGRSADAEREVHAAAALSVTTDMASASESLDLRHLWNLMQQGRNREVIDLLLPVISLRQGRLLAQDIQKVVALGKAYMGEREYADAAEQFERCMHLNREYAIKAHILETIALLGDAYYALGRETDALKAWEEGLLLFREAPHGYNSKAAGHLALKLTYHNMLRGDHKTAGRLYEEAEEAFAQANWPLTYSYAAISAALENEPEAAVATLRATLSGPYDTGGEPPIEDSACRSSGNRQRG